MARGSNTALQVRGSSDPNWSSLHKHCRAYSGRRGTFSELGGSNVRLEAERYVETTAQHANTSNAITRSALVYVKVAGN